MLGLLIIFSFWVAITLIIVIPLIITFALGNYLAEKIGFEGFSYYCFMILLYIIILCIFIII